MEVISIREFSRRVKTTDTTIRNDRGTKIGEDAFGVHPGNGRPVVFFELALAYWNQYNPVVEWETVESIPEPEPVKVKKVKPEKNVKIPQPVQQKKEQPKVVKEIHKPKQAASYDINGIVEAERREKFARAELAEINLAKAKGELVDIVQVRKSLFDFGAEVRKAVQAIPALVIDDVLSSNTREEAVLLMDIAINKALLSLTESDTRKLNK